ncbi:disease resistance protein At4g27190-like [Mercurialis annua]|uniref:disease resistance protein At4g27190-like n=1 Tax=Mercurialis annua TaxID=3986 RepID=UPI00215F2B2B|nr:disease resistance protein At4g27190-like [Mercurialis annua]XP_050228113.1 disease resistance protein At4g27190-like [Mercurialis annua]
MDFIMSVATSVATDIAKSVIAPIGRQIGYIIYYSRNVNNLRVELQKLVDKKTTEVDPRVDNAARNLENVAASVTNWQKAVNDVNGAATDFLDDEVKRNNKCMNGLCPNPISHHSLGRKAVKIAADVLTLLQEADQWPFLNQIAIPAPPSMSGSTFDAVGIRLFESRRSIEHAVCEALKDDNLGMIGLCGMGGVGKTTLVKKLMKRALNEQLFDEIVMAVVSQSPNIQRLQGEIAAPLGLQFDNESLLGRAGKLHARIADSEKRILLILDDVWNELNFEEIGLPPPNKSRKYKIVLTSRNKDVCNVMGSQKNFEIQVLENEEAWSLFREMAGDSFDQVAREVSDECRGLPIAIVTLAKALKNKTKEIWDDALVRLKNSNTEGIRGMEKDVLFRIELSYDYLENEEAKSCFLMCCLYPEDYDVPVEYLVRYGIGLGLFKNVRTVQQARNRVYAIIDELKASFLLLNGDAYLYDSVKMHDLVRDVAIRIASKDQHRYIVSCDAEINKWPEGTDQKYRDCTAISLFCSKIKEHPVDLECPKLQLLQVECGKDSQSLPENLFEGMIELKVVSLKIPSLPRSLDVLKKLQTLHLKLLHFGDISTIGALQSLQILCIKSGSYRSGSIFSKKKKERSFKYLPTEIGMLKNLRLLDLWEMEELEYIPSGVLSRLSKLEELYVTSFFFAWGVTTEDGKTNASLNEIESHPITGLKIGIQNSSVLCKESVFENLTRFKIIMSPFAFVDRRERRRRDSVNELYIGGDAIEIKNSAIHALLRTSEGLMLKNSNVKTVHELEDNGCPYLKKIAVHSCDRLECFVDATKGSPSSQEITQLRISDSVQLPCYANLRVIKVQLCCKLRYVFPLSVARGLRHLESLDIYKCDEMEVIFYREEEDYGNMRAVLEFPKLKELSLVAQKLISAVGHLNPNQLKEDDCALKTSTMSWKSKKIVEQCLFPSHWLQAQNLQNLELSNCNSLKVVFSPSGAQQLVQLKGLSIIECEQLQFIVAEEEEDTNKGTTKIVLFPSLTYLYLYRLPEIVAFCPNRHISFDLPLFKNLHCEECPKMKRFCSTTPTQSMLNQTASCSIDGVHNVSRSKTSMPSLIVPRIARRGSQQESVKTNTQTRHPISGEDQLQKEDLSQQINGRNGTSCLFPSNLIEKMPSLKTVKLESCEAVEVMFSFEKCADGVLLGDFEKMDLHTLPSLVHVWLSISPQVTAFQSLKQLTIVNCEKLLHVWSRGVDENMIEQGKSKIVFPQLTILELESLHNLTSFCTEICAVTVELPLLETFRIKDCNQMRSFSYGASVITPKLKEIKTDEFNYSLNEDLNVTFQNVMPRLVMVDDKYYLAHSGSSTFRSFIVRNCKTMLNSIPRNFTISLQNLEKLWVKECDSFIFKYEEGDVVTFSHLEDIYLENLPKLEHLFNKFTINVIGFQKLTNLRVRYCDSLRSIFSSSMAKGLLQLQALEISYCSVLTEIIVEEDEEEEEVEIVFPQLRSLFLSDLDKLTSFCNGTCSLEFPLLQDISIGGCTQMKTFTYGSLITPKLKKARLNRREYDSLIGDQDLNATLHQRYKPKEEETLEIRGSSREVEVDVTKGTPNAIEGELDDVGQDVSHLTRHEIDVMEETSIEENVEILQDIKFQSGQSSVEGENHA